jgi:hypothetical protein
LRYPSVAWKLKLFIGNSDGRMVKKLGENGEDVVAAFMNMIGWKAPLQ